MHDIVFLFDVDNTLLDNDRVQADIREHLGAEYGEHIRTRYWALFEELRNALGYADYIGALERLRGENLHDPRLLEVGGWLLEYPFASRIYPRALEAVAHAQHFGPTVILSDGDAVFQPRKVARSGLWEAFEGRVLIYPHKEEELADIERLFPARHYVLIDDKLRILDAVKKAWRNRVTTVFPRQGHYAHDPALLAAYPSGDLTIENIGELAREEIAWTQASRGELTR